MSDVETKIMFFGEDIETLPREKLVQAVRILNGMLREHQTPQAMHERSLGRMARLKAGLR